MWLTTKTSNLTHIDLKYLLDICISVDVPNYLLLIHNVPQHVPRYHVHFPDYIKHLSEPILNNLSELFCPHLCPKTA